MVLDGFGEDGFGEGKIGVCVTQGLNLLGNSLTNWCVSEREGSLVGVLHVSTSFVG